MLSKRHELAIVEEILYHCIKKKSKIAEIPIDFEDRKHGKSNLSLLVLAKTLRSIYEFKGK